MSDVRIYMSFDLEHDRDLHDRLEKQARKPASFAVSSRSEGGEMTDEWIARVRGCIAASDEVVVICGEHTDESAQVSAELRIAQEEHKPYVLLWGRRESMCKKPKGARSEDGMYLWTPSMFCLGDGLVNSFQSALFSASTLYPYQFNRPTALNCYAPMPFAKRAVVELINESDEPHGQYFYVDYETLEAFPADMGYFHAEFRRTNPFGGWGHEVTINSKEVDVVNKERTAWENNYSAAGDQGPRTLHRLQHVGHQLHRQLVGRGR